jgi:hypothetical protein
MFTNSHYNLIPSNGKSHIIPILNQIFEENKYDVFSKLFSSIKLIPKYFDYIKTHINNSYRILNISYDRIQSYDISQCINKTEIETNVNLTCDICTFLFDSPLLLPCNHTVCSYCIYSISNTNCPFCRKYFNYNQLVKNNVISKIIDKLIIKCDICNNEHKVSYKCIPDNPEVYCLHCYSKMGLLEFANHYTICSLRECRYCKQYGYKWDIFEHEISCPEKYCDNCKNYKDTNIIDNVHICYKICDHCGYQINLNKYINHYKKCIKTKKYSTSIFTKLIISYKTPLSKGIYNNGKKERIVYDNNKMIKNKNFKNNKRQWIIKR